MAKPSNVKNPTTIELHKTQVDGDSTINRRRMLTMGTALAIATTSPALAFPSVWQDAELIELGLQLDTLRAQWREAGENVSRLADVAQDQYPLLPDVLKARDTDKQFGLPKPNDGHWYKPTKGGNREEPGYYVTGQLNDLKNFNPRRALRIPADQYVAEYTMETGQEWPAIYYKSDETVATTVAWPEAKARVDELITAIEAWQKACRRIDHECGYMKAEREFQRIANKDSTLLDKICNIEARTLQGILVKARAVKHIHMDDDLIEFGECTDDILAASILNELLALKPPTGFQA